MRRFYAVMAWTIVLAACVETGGPATTGEPTTIPPAATTTSEITTTSVVTDPVIEITDLPTDSPCEIDSVPEGGEATVLVGTRLYGLGADGATPRCLALDIQTADLEWGPLGDRLRVESQILGFGATMAILHPSATAFEWTAPSGSRIVVVSGEELLKVDVPAGTETDISFLEETAEIAYHPAGTHLLAIGTAFDGQYGLWLATNQGGDALLLASDEGAVLTDPAWSWLGEPLFVAGHPDGHWHIHRVDLTAEGALEGPVVVDVTDPIDMVTPARHDPVMLAYRLGATGNGLCVEGARAAVNGAELPEPLSTWASSPIGWLSTERLLVMAYPEGCDSPGDLWSFSVGLCPGSEYGAHLIIADVDGAAAREAAPQPPPSPDFTGIIDPAPA